MTTVDLYPYLILVGASILVASARMLYHYRTQSSRGQKLILLNEELDYDLPNFLRSCWPTLEEGRFIGMQWELDWFGTTISGKEGSFEGQIIERDFQIREIFVSVKLYHRQRGWDQKHFTESLAENFFLLVRMDIWIKLGSTQRAFDQAAKVNVFLQHDVKNMIQILGLMGSFCEAAKPGQEKETLENLKQSIPAVRDRADHMLSELTDKIARSQTPEADLPRIRLEEVIRETAMVYNLPIELQGQGAVRINKENLLSIIDNLIGNYSYQASKGGGNNTLLQASIDSDNEHVRMTLRDGNGRACQWPERLFEPFWSEFGMGRGIGLYQAKHLAEIAGGSLGVVSKVDEILKFELRLPKKTENYENM